MKTGKFYLSFLPIILLLSCMNDSDKKMEVISVDVAEARIDSIAKKLVAAGKVVAEKEFLIPSPMRGSVKEIIARNGLWVDSGAVLIKLKDDYFRMDLEKAKAAKSAKEIVFQKMTLDYVDINDWESEKGQDVRKMLRSYSGLEVAEINLQEALEALDNTSIRTPVGGIVDQLVVQEDEYLSDGQLLCKVYHPAHMEVITFFPEEEGIYLYKDQEASVYIDDAIESAPGIIKWVDNKPNENGMIKVLISLEGDNLLPDKPARVETISKYWAGMLIPVDGVLLKNGKPAIYKEVDGKAIFQFVELGMASGQEIEITSGLSLNEKVIISNLNLLESNSQVTINN